MKKSSLVFFTLLTLIACEKETNVNYSIDNQSVDTIEVNGTNIISATTIDLTINPNQKIAIATWSKRGKETDYYQPTTMFGDDLLITNLAGDTLVKDYKSLANWAKKVKNKRATADHEYVLIIEDSDF